MLGVDRRQHVFLTQVFVAVLLGLGIEAGVVIGIVALRTGGAGKNRLAQAAHTTGAGVPIPAVVAAVRIGVAIADESGSSRLLRREHGIQSEQPQAPGLFEVRIHRQRFDFGSSDDVVTGVVTDFDVIDHALILAGTNVLALAVVKSQVV